MAVPYAPGAFGDLSCPRCGEPLPETECWMVLTPDSDPALLDLVERGELNLATCAVCGQIGDLNVPVLWAEPGRSILVYDAFTASREESAIRRDIFAELAELDGFDVEALRGSSLTVRDFMELIDFLEMDDDLFDLAVTASRMREARMGLFGADRVEAILRDVEACPVFFIGDYERSAELLGHAEFWQGEQAESLRAIFADGLDPEDETATPGLRPRRLPPSARERFNAALAEAAEVITAEEGELIGTERALGVLVDRAITLTPEEAERFGGAGAEAAARFEGLAEVFERLGAEPPEPPAEPPGRDALREVVGRVGGGEYRPFAWDLLPEAVEPPPGLEEAVAAYVDGRYEEALERALLAERSCEPDQVRLCALYTAMLTLECDRPYGRGLARDAIAATVASIEETGQAEVNELTGLAHVQRVLGEVERQVGEFQWSLNYQLTAFDLYLTLSDWGWLSEVGPALVVSLVAFGRKDEAFQIALLLDNEEFWPRVPREPLARMFSAMASIEEPGLELVCDLGDGQTRVVERDGHPSRIIVEFRAPGQPDQSASTMIIGNRGLNELVRLLAAADDDDPADRLRLLLAVQQVEAYLLGSGREFRETVDMTLVRNVHQLVAMAMRAAGDDPPLPVVADVALAFATACQVAVTEALRADEIFARGGSTGDLGAYLWGLALLTGKVAYELDRVLDGLRRFTMTDHGSLTEAVLTSYALTLETAGELDKVIDLYRELIPRAEKRRSVFLNRTLTLWAQAAMSPPYIRLSRCLFARFLSGGDLGDAFLAADALERHRARELRRLGIARSGTEPSRWLVAPLDSASAALPDGHAVVCVGLHPHTVRVPGRWMAVGTSAGGAGAWAQETTPPELLYETHLWFAHQMQQAAQAVRRARVATMAEYTAILEQHVPAADAEARLCTLWKALGEGAGRFGELLISTEDYALLLPWSAAALVAAEREPVVRVLATTATAGQRPGAVDPAPSIVVAVQDDHSDRENARLAEAGEQVADLIAAEQPSDDARVIAVPQSELSVAGPAHALVLLGHGRRGHGLSHRLHEFAEPPRTVVLLGCWSAHIDQNLAHMEVEGLAVDLLGAGVEAVVASLWPVTLEAGALLTSAYLAELSQGLSPGRAFASARAALRSDPAFDHPAVWCGFTLFG
ncbi:CHAT domain-containing protein [Spongiactinospora sp. TRM90649]|uniref:CHAT domain-containing protein n=1 Tax=Spongiactinospora sp. TRM90649 TaxID=3031114 RepID=UPI0023F83289|nr:CHAT domain-containing protein [Spongiactinospora sp. TRM90649]MDF5756238.1 CHAT domain-containing protein [Spongiactinospora sp. TRM90649]